MDDDTIPDDTIPQPSGLRIGTAERERAAEALGEHLRAGRLDTVEYDERAAAAYAARTADQIHPLFADLPGGSPLPSAAAGVAPPGTAPYGTEAYWGPRERTAGWAAAGGRWGPPGPGYRRRGPGWLLPAALVFAPFLIASLVFGGDDHHEHGGGHPPFFLLPLFLVFLFFMIGRVRGGFGPRRFGRPWRAGRWGNRTTTNGSDRTR